MSTVVDVERPTERPPAPDVLPRRWRPSARVVIAVVVTLVVLYLLFGPLVILLASSFQDTSVALPLSSGSTWSLTNIKAVFGASATWHLLLTTVEYALGSLVLAGVLSTALAWLIERTTIPLRRTLYVLVVASSGIPGLIFAIAWSLLLNPTTGAVNDFFHWAFGFRFNALSLPGMIFVQGIQLVPLMFLLISAAFRGMNGSLEDAAAASGASTFTTLRRITLPMLAPALLGAVIYNFVNVVEWVDIPLVLGLPGHVSVLATKVYLTVQPPIGLPNYGLASSYGLVLVILSMVPLVIYNRLIRRSSRYATMTGKGYRPRRVDLGRWRWLALFGVFVYVGVVLLLPVLMLFWSSIQPYYGGFNSAAFHRISFGAYSDLFSSSTLWPTVWNTVELGALTALGTVIISVLSSWLVVRARNRLAGTLDFLIFFPHMIPSIVIGLAILLVYLILPISIYGTLWIIVIAMITKYMALGTRITTPGVAQVHVSLEEAAEVSGGGVRHVWRRVLLPLLRNVLGNGYLVVFLVAVQNLTLPLLLTSPGNDVLSTLIWNRYDLGYVQSAAALSILMTLLTIIVAAALRGSSKTERAASAA
ncbi:MAG TPA: iron ABC transporter permease [Micromonosporaceae bacterium]|jgi:iron(III) transport system permease protein